MPWVPASRTSSGYGSAPVYDSACRDSRPTCGPLPCAITMLCSAASGAIASAATLTFRRWTSVVIASDRRSSALPPSAITIRILGLLTRTDWSSVSRHGAWLGQAAALGDVDGDAEQQSACRQEVRRPVHPEALAGVARVHDEQDREHQRQHGDDHVAGEAGGVHLLVVDPAPLELGEGGEAVGDGGGDARHQHQGGGHGGAAGAQVVDRHREGGQHGGGDDAVSGHAFLGYAFELLWEQAVLGGGQGHLRADQGPPVQRAQAGNDDRDRHHVPGPGAAEYHVGRVGERGGRVGQLGGGQHAEHRDQRQYVYDRGGDRAQHGGAGDVAVGVADPGGGDRGGLHPQVAEQRDGHPAADRVDRAFTTDVPGGEVSAGDEEQADGRYERQHGEL